QGGGGWAPRQARDRLDEGGGAGDAGAPRRGRDERALAPAGARLLRQSRHPGGVDGRSPVTRFQVNGRAVEVTADTDMPLLWALRDELGLTGTKYACGAAQCGACTVHLDGQAIRSCVTPLTAAEGRRVTTIEGALGSGATGRVARAVQ